MEAAARSKGAGGGGGMMYTQARWQWHNLRLSSWMQPNHSTPFSLKSPHLRPVGRQYHHETPTGRARVVQQGVKGVPRVLGHARTRSFAQESFSLVDKQEQPPAGSFFFIIEYVMSTVRTHLTMRRFIKTNIEPMCGRTTNSVLH